MSAHLLALFVSLTMLIAPASAVTFNISGHVFCSNVAASTPIDTSESQPKPASNDFPEPLYTIPKATVQLWMEDMLFNDGSNPRYMLGEMQSDGNGSFLVNGSDILANTGQQLVFLTFSHSCLGHEEVEPSKESDDHCTFESRLVLHPFFGDAVSSDNVQIEGLNVFLGEKEHALLTGHQTSVSMTRKKICD